MFPSLMQPCFKCFSCCNGSNFPLVVRGFVQSLITLTCLHQKQLPLKDASHQIYPNAKAVTL